MSFYLINGRTPVHKDSGGKLVTVDVCLTQVGNSVTPIPYVNVAESKDADKTFAGATEDGNELCTIDSTFAKSRGDEPGGKKGVISRTQGDYAYFITSSFNTLNGGRPAVRAGDLMVSNAGNTPPAALVQAMGLPPVPNSTFSPETLAALEGPNHNAILHHRPTGPAVFNLTADLAEPEGQPIRLAPPPTEPGLSELDGIVPERSALALVIKEATPHSDKTDNHILLPLGEAEHIPMDEPIEEPATQLAYLRPRRYLTPERDPEQTDTLRPGWLYVFVNGHLWRELAVGEGGLFQDVDLRTWQGWDHIPQSSDHPNNDFKTRPATGAGQRILEVPYRLNGEPCDIQVAYSKVQWSWPRLISLGGLNPEDPRLRHRVQEGDTLDSLARRYPAVVSARALAERNGLAAHSTLTVDQVLSILPATEPPPEAEQNRANRLGEPLDLDALMAGDFVLNLEDPLGQAEDRLLEQFIYRQRIADLVDDLKNGRLPDASVQPELEGAALDPEPCRADKTRLAQAVNLAFNRVPLALDDPGEDLDDDTRKALRHYRDCAQNDLDQAYLSDYLHLADLEQLARHLLAAKIELVELFEQTGPLSLTEALLDYGYLPTLQQYRFFKRMLELTFNLKDHPLQPCSQWFPNDDLFRELATLDPGEDLILQLVGTHPEGQRHPLADMLTPEDTGPGLDDYQSREAPYFNIDTLLKHEAFTHRDINRNTFDTTRNAVTLLFNLYKAWFVLPDPQGDARTDSAPTSTTGQGAGDDTQARLEREWRGVNREFALESDRHDSLRELETDAQNRYQQALQTDPHENRAATKGAFLAYSSLRDQRLQSGQAVSGLEKRKGELHSARVLARKQNHLTNGAGQPARLSQQKDPLRPLVKSLQALTRVFTEVEVTATQYFQMRYPGQALPLDLPIRHHTAQSRYANLKQALRGEGALVTAYLDSGQTHSIRLPVGSGLKRTELSQTIADLARDAQYRVGTHPDLQNPPEPKVKVLALKRTDNVWAKLPEAGGEITFTPVPQATIENSRVSEGGPLGDYHQERIDALKQRHGLTSRDLAPLTATGGDKRMRAAISEGLANQFDREKTIAAVHPESIASEELRTNLEVEVNGKRVALYRTYQGLFSAAAILEMVNLVKVLEAPDKDKVERRINVGIAASSITALLAHLHNTRVEFFFGQLKQVELDKYTQYRRDVKAGKIDRSKVMNSDLKLTRYKYYSAMGMQFFSGIANGFGIGAASMATHDAWKKNDPWSVTGQGLIAIGSTVGLGTDAWSLLHYATLRTVTVPYARALGWWSLGLTFLGFGIAAFLKDTPMETWLKHSPFGRVRHNIKDDSFKHWADWPALAEEGLATLRLHPSMSWSEWPSVPQTNADYWSQSLELHLRLPAWTDGQSTLDLTLWWRPADSEQDWRPLAMDKPANAFGPAQIDWRHTSLTPRSDGSGINLRLTWQALRSLLLETSALDLKAELAYYPQGKNKPFSRALNQHLAIPAPERKTPPFATPKEPSVATAVHRLSATIPPISVPLPDIDERPIRLLTGQPQR